jgi:hypothetical protein
VARRPLDLAAGYAKTPVAVSGGRFSWNKS